MSDRKHVVLIGATGLIGRQVMAAAVGRPDIRLTAIARREVPLPRGARMEMRLASPENWGEILQQLRPDSVICALGTTIAKVGGDKDAFRAVDHHLVMDVARAALTAGARQFVTVSAVGASLAAKNFYLQVKGEAERDLSKLGFKRLDILHPGLLRGSRQDDARPAERLGIIAAPALNLFLHGKYRKYRAIEANTVARAALSLVHDRPGGRFVHEYDSIQRAARRLAEPA